LSDLSTELFEQARKIVAEFINATPQEIVFVRGTTEGINLLASSLGESLQEGDEIIISDIEHHANIVPWQQIAIHKKLVLKSLETSPEGNITEDHLNPVLSSRTKILALTHASNHLGNIIDIKKIIALAHKKNVLVVVDGAQAIGKMHIDVKDLDVDFYAFSGHKIFSPFGIGVLYGKESLLQKMPPYQTGGSMISKVSFEKTTFNDIPFRFEAGTPDVGGAIALGAAIQFIQQIGIKAIEDYEAYLVNSLLTKLSTIPDLTFYGPKQAQLKIPVFAFNINKLHHSDVGFILNQQGIAVRTGHHCTYPLLKKLNLNGSIRASFSIYNTEEDLDKLISGLIKAKELLR
jgi:cysteine desulfurase/selenocysteine lyase